MRLYSTQPYFIILFKIWIDETMPRKDGARNEQVNGLLKVSKVLGPQMIMQKKCPFFFKKVPFFRSAPPCPFDLPAPLLITVTITISCVYCYTCRSIKTTKINI